jgi:hypothetical protein
MRDRSIDDIHNSMKMRKADIFGEMDRMHNEMMKDFGR